MRWEPQMRKDKRAGVSITLPPLKEMLLGEGKGKKSRIEFDKSSLAVSLPSDFLTSRKRSISDPDLKMSPSFMTVSLPAMRVRGESSSGDGASSQNVAMLSPTSGSSERDTFENIAKRGGDNLRRTQPMQHRCARGHLYGPISSYSSVTSIPHS